MTPQRYTAALAVSSILLAILFAQPQPVDGEPRQAASWADCLACHLEMSPSGLPRLSELRPAGLGNRTATGCYECHSELELRGMNSDWRHPVRSLAEHLNCTDCHVAAPHDRDTPPPLPTGDYVSEGCYECHAEVNLKRNLMTGHGNSGGPDCRDCHKPHEPFRAALPTSLLPTEFASELHASYDWFESNSECLWCHPSGSLFSDEQQGFVILNTLNLHDRHVVMGRVLCLECHDPHGSLTPGSVRGQLYTGELLSFTQGLRGGSCAINCHGVEHEDWEYINRGF